ncbi:protein cramped-like [Dreissena polymorpha]|uniref:SANT domain-containing protein n=1 Tax=Dreissena polymorpha TaxID=45954 RepID=A0A9D4QKV7_DREPO|nr:protein cramped-like [Dreissena polymorpha]KAH3835018.1 hypothetical protein DPMN_108356 [Dreissena polymorpha]
MPPRKRRQSTHCDDNGRDIGEGDGIPSSVEKVKNPSDILKGVDSTAEKKIPTAHLTLEAEFNQIGNLETESGQIKSFSAATSESCGKQPTRFSTRIVKRPRRDLSPPESPVKKGKKAATSGDCVSHSGTPETKGKRQWELWSQEDKDSFFEGLCEYGKDFESIHNFIVAKSKKKSSSVGLTVKNKEQVRHFYYRTWHKISKLIKPVQDLKKDVQELYGLISYSVFRKRLRCGLNLNDKNWQKLNDLVHHGAATIKLKGKRIRLKTPVCNALKKLNLFEEPKREPGPKLPDKITVEFRPRTNYAWHRVQDLAHNPRVRVTVNPDRHLVSIIKYLDQKWTSQRLKHKERLGATEVSCEEFRVFPWKQATLRSLSLEPVDEPVLQFSLDKHCKEFLSSPHASKKRKDRDGLSVQQSLAVVSEVYDDVTKSVISENLCQCPDGCATCECQELMEPRSLIDSVRSLPKQSNLCPCMCNKSETHGRRSADPDDWQERNTNVSAGAGSEGSECDYRPEGPSEITDYPSERTIQSSQCVEAKRFSTEVSVMADGEDAMFPDTVDTEHFNAEFNSPNSETSANASFEDLDNEIEPECARSLSEQMASSQTNAKNIFSQMLETGWGLGGSSSVTVAELYLMFGGEGEVKCEYDWVRGEQPAHLIQEELLITLNNMLRRLSHLATMEITDFSKTTGVNMTCQLCGHTPSSSVKASKPASAKRSRRDISTQTLPVQNTSVSLAVSTLPMSSIPVTSENGFFRIPVMPTACKTMVTTSSALSAREMIQRYNPANLNVQKPFMRRKLKPLRGRSGSTQTSLIQRTILPKNSEYIAIIPMVPGTQIPNPPPSTLLTSVSTVTGQVNETIIGHPVSGIPTQPLTFITNPPTVTTMAATSFSPKIAASTDIGSCHTPQSTSEYGSMNLSPNGDETLLHIPESHLGSMSPQSLKAAGMSAVRDTGHMATHSSSYHATTTSYCGPVSPPNLSALLDISLSTGDLEADTTFSSLLDDNSKSLTLDRGLVTPPIRSEPDQRSGRPSHSPPVRSLFRASTPEHSWSLNGDIQDLSLSSLLESPCKPANSTPLALFNENSRDFHAHRHEVDATLQSMMQESSIDYVRKFQDLAEQITRGDLSSTQDQSTAHGS